MRQRLDVSELRLFAFGSRSTLFWGTLLLCCIEGTAFAILFASYFYLRGNFHEWPPSRQMEPIGGAISAFVLVASIAPMAQTMKAARTLDLRATRRWQTISTAVGAVGLALRFWEFHALPFPWNENAYASVVWVIFGFHTADYVAEIGEMFVLSSLLFKGPVEEKHFEDIEVNALFWSFLALAWVPLSAVMYIDGVVR